MRIVSFFSALCRYIEKRDLKKKLNGFNIICFHSIGVTGDVYSIDGRELEKIINTLKPDIIGINEIENHTTTWPKFIITFDDGYKSVYTEAFPLLKKMDVSFTVFFSTGMCGKENYMTQEDIKKLSEYDKCCIGSHMVTHRMTRQMNQEEIQKEWEESKEFLENITGKDVTYGALPYGTVSSCSIKSLRTGIKVGYDSIATTLAIRNRNNRRVLFRYVYQKNNNRVEMLIDKYKALLNTNRVSGDKR